MKSKILLIYFIQLFQSLFFISNFYQKPDQGHVESCGWRNVSVNSASPGCQMLLENGMHAKELHDLNFSIRCKFLVLEGSFYETYKYSHFYILLLQYADFCCATMWINHNYTDIPSLCAFLLSSSHSSRSLQSARLGFLCYTATSHQLSILHSIVYICWC